MQALSGELEGGCGNGPDRRLPTRKFRLTAAGPACVGGSVLTPSPLPGPIPPGVTPPASARPFSRVPGLGERRLLALLLALFLLRDLPWRLDDFDQAKQAFTSLEMVEGGAWWFQHTPGSRGIGHQAAARRMDVGRRDL